MQADDASRRTWRRSARRGWLRTRFASDAGFSLLEMFVVCALIGTMTAVTIMVTVAAVKPSKAESAAATVKAFLQDAREYAIAHRRLVRISFPASNQILSQEVQLDGTLRDVATTVLENKMEFTTFDGLADTPDLYGNATPIFFTGQQPVAFTSDGMFVDVNGDPTNGTLSIGVPNDRTTISAVTVLGTTALVRQWRWNGSQWVE